MEQTISLFINLIKYRLRPDLFRQVFQEQISQEMAQKLMTIAQKRSLVTPGRAHMELHYRLMESVEAIDSVLDRVWGYSQPVAGKI